MVETAMTLISSVTVGPQASADKGTVDPGLKAIIDELNDDSGAVSSRRKAAIMDDIQQRRYDIPSSNKATQDYFTAGFTASSFQKRGNELSMQLHSQLSARVSQSHSSSDTFELQLGFYKALSEDDKIAFAAYKGQSPEDWQATMEARLKLADRIEAAQASGELGLDGHPTGKASAALSMLIEISDAFHKMNMADKAAVNAWTRSVNETFGRPPAVRVDLSDEAKAYLNRV